MAPTSTATQRRSSGTKLTVKNGGTTVFTMNDVTVENGAQI